MDVATIASHEQSSAVNPPIALTVNIYLQRPCHVTTQNYTMCALKRAAVVTHFGSMKRPKMTLEDELRGQHSWRNYFGELKFGFKSSTPIKERWPVTYLSVQTMYKNVHLSALTKVAHRRSLCQMKLHGKILMRPSCRNTSMYVRDLLQYKSKALHILDLNLTIVITAYIATQ